MYKTKCDKFSVLIWQFSIQQTVKLSLYGAGFGIASYKQDFFCWGELLQLPPSQIFLKTTTLTLNWLNLASFMLSIYNTMKYYHNF